METYTLCTDGGARGNPGPGSIGFALYDEGGTLIHKEGRPIGVCTNNQAEYQALIEGLKVASGFTKGDILHISDSELLVKQVTGEYRVKNPVLKNLHAQVRAGRLRFEHVQHRHERRDYPGIKVADKILNHAADRDEIVINDN